MIKGTLVPALTFFDKDGNIDEKFTSWHMNWVLDNGVNGLFVTGTYGSGYLMSPEQRVRVYEIAREITKSHPGTFAVAHVGANDSATSVYLTEHARDLGYDAVRAVNPYTFKYRDDELVGYYSDLVKAAGSMPIFAYNNPSLTSKAIGMDLVRKFAEVGVSAMKDSSLNRDLALSIREFRENEGADFEYISGSTKDWDYFRTIGVKAMIAGACNYVPDLVSSMYRLSLKDDDESFMKACESVNYLSSFTKVGNSLISSHLALRSRGYDVPYMKRPLICPYDEYKEKMAEDKAAIDEAVELIKSLDLEYKFVK